MSRALGEGDVGWPGLDEVVPGGGPLGPFQTVGSGSVEVGRGLVASVHVAPGYGQGPVDARCTSRDQAYVPRGKPVWSADSWGGPLGELRNAVLAARHGNA